MKRKKIAVYCDSMNNGGTEKATLDLVNNLPKEKYDITVIQLGPGGKYQKELAPHIKNKEIYPSIQQSNGDYIGGAEDSMKSCQFLLYIDWC